MFIHDYKHDILLDTLPWQQGWGLQTLWYYAKMIVGGDDVGVNNFVCKLLLKVPFFFSS